MLTDLFFLESDRHRVRLLAKLLVRLGVDAVLRPAVASPRSETVLVVCTAAALGEDWLTEILARHPGAIALMLDGVPLPKSCMRAVDLTSWPARSADAEVAALVRWLKNPAADAAFGVLPARRFKGIAGAGANRDGPNPWLTASLLLGLVAGFGVLVWWTMPGEREDEGTIQPTAALPATRSLDDRSRHGVPPSAAAESGRGLNPAPGTPGGFAVAPAAAVDEPNGSAPSPARRDAQGAGAPGANDALSRLCRAGNPAAAKAWLGALNWKQRRRLPDVACVRQLASRPGFETFTHPLVLPPG